MPQTQLSVLDKLYEDISRRMEQRFDLEDINVTKGAVPKLAMHLYSNLSPYESITITNRLSGSYTLPKREVEVQLAKIKIGNEIRDIEVARQFEYCHGCAKIPSCDQFEAGSILFFPEKMCTGYTYQDVSYNRSIGLPFGNCEFRFQGHHPSEDLYKVANYLHFEHMTPRDIELVASCHHFKTLDQIQRDIYQINMTCQEVERMNFAIDCASIIQESHSSLKKRRFPSIKDIFAKIK